MDDKRVESSLGWKVSILSIDSMVYQENDKKIFFKIEDYPDAMGELEWTIYIPTQCRWKGANDQDIIDQEKLDEIIDRVSTAFWKLDMRIKEIA
mgnify:CR=1 FL=1